MHIKDLELLIIMVIIIKRKKLLLLILLKKKLENILKKLKLNDNYTSDNISKDELVQMCNNLLK